MSCTDIDLTDLTDLTPRYFTGLPTSGLSRREVYRVTSQGCPSGRLASVSPPVCLTCHSACNMSGASLSTK